MQPEPRETELRRQLGIPAEARSVLILAESSHWDPSWLYTSEEYFQRWVRPNLDAAIMALEAEPRRIYSVECMFFLRMYWERCPEQREHVRELINAGRLRLTSSGVTTPDTIIPSAEALLRDFLLGQEWLRANQMTPEPCLAYFTDSFGASPLLPSLLRAAGFDRTALSRIDGMYFLSADYETPARFPRPGSSAELLLTRERSIDFVWRDRYGAEVLAHWNAFTYGQGDLLAYRGLARVYLAPLALPDASEQRVAGRIGEYIAQLKPVSRTPYLFCPIGFDFNAPIPNLTMLLDRYNLHSYPSTGVWAINAGLDDYLALVECHRHQLPVVELDPNPYWTGFYTARPSLKQQHHTLVETLLLAERLSLLPEHADTAPAVSQELADAWWDAASANHHDCITGTSPDRVVETEQRPWIERAQAAASAVVTRLAPMIATPPATATDAHPLPSWKRANGLVEVVTPAYTLELSEDAGGAITGCRDTTNGQALLAGLANDLISYVDTGGLWRMGHEYRGGRLEERECASERPARLLVATLRGGIELSCTTQLDGEPITRRLWLSAGDPCIRMRVEGRAAERRTITLRFGTGLAVESLAMDAPGGVVERPRRKVYDPTFWPLQSFVHIQDRATGRGAALFLGRPGAVCLGAYGDLELVALRNATRELAYGILPLPATPATGHERSQTALDYTLRFTAEGDWRANALPRLARACSGSPWAPEEQQALREIAGTMIQVDHPDLAVLAVKPAASGTGMIVRLAAPTVPTGAALLIAPGRAIQAAWLCDARERDLHPLNVRDGRVELELPGPIVTVRLMIDNTEHGT